MNREMLLIALALAFLASGCGARIVSPEASPSQTPSQSTKAELAPGLPETAREAQPVPTPTPEPVEATPTQIPAPEAQPVPTPTPEPVEATPTQIPAPEAQPVPTQTPEPAEATPTQIPAPEGQPVPTQTPEPAEATPTQIPTPGPTSDKPTQERRLSDLEIITLLPFDAIPAILEPRFLSDEEAREQYAEGELVLGVSINSDHRAYSVPYLSSREIVNDVVGRVPIAVTW